MRAPLPIAVPPEWAPQRAIWTAWPADAREWNGELSAPRVDVAALVRALAPANRVRVLADGAEAQASASEAVGAVAEIVPARYGDIWLRDTGPIFARGPQGPLALRFQTNGWGGKFERPGDATVGDEVAMLAGVSIERFGFVLEGGAIEHDGQGTVLTTRQTLLHRNRNGWSQAEAEAALRRALGARRVLWLDQGLGCDHTDGHVDNLARFVGPQRVVCQHPAGGDDPNAAVLEATVRELERATDAQGRRLHVTTIPSPGAYRNARGELSPASHLNFVIANETVVVPTYETSTQPEALETLQTVFPGRRVVGVTSRGLLGCGDAGGGSFHCITQQEPRFAADC